MGKRIYNFNPGPAALPLEILQQGQEEFVEFQDLGMSLMEISHRSKQYEQVNDETQQLLLKILGIKSGYQVLFMAGGASTQFALVPMNFLKPGQVGSYVLTGSFAEKAYQEAAVIGETAIAASTSEHNWSRLPAANEIRIAENSAYLHVTGNNTIEGSQFKEFPDTGSIPLIGDLTSGILSREMDLDKFSLFYAGAQKNLGPAGVTVVVIRDELVKESAKNIPTIFRYETYAKNKSLYNTPPVHSVYMMNLMLKWVEQQGGVPKLEQRNSAKAGLIYDVIDQSGGFYQGLVDKENRSIMNITWRMQDEAMEKRFVQESQRSGFEGLAGHRSVGGLRASAYNAVPYEACQALADFMLDFQRRNG